MQPGQGRREGGTEAEEGGSGGMWLRLRKNLVNSATSRGGRGAMNHGGVVIGFGGGVQSGGQSWRRDVGKEVRRDGGKG